MGAVDALLGFISAIPHIFNLVILGSQREALSCRPARRFSRLQRVALLDILDADGGAMLAVRAVLVLIRRRQGIVVGV